MDPITLICLFLVAVIIIAAFLGRVDLVGGILAAAFIVLLLALFGPTFHR